LTAKIFLILANANANQVTRQDFDWHRGLLVILRMRRIDKQGFSTILKAAMAPFSLAINGGRRKKVNYAAKNG